MLLTQVLLMQWPVLTEVELNWQHGGHCINLCVCLCVSVGEKVGINPSTTRRHQALFFKSHINNLVPI